jgi:subtilase family serine protease
MKPSIVVRVLMGSLVIVSTLCSQAQVAHPAQTTKGTAPDVISRVTKVKGLKFAMASQQAPPDGFCRINFGTPCYSPQQIQKAYDLTSTLAAGYTGSGQTIIIIDSFGSPTIAQDLQAFDAAYGLPDPPSFTVLSPLGTVPFDPTNSDQVGWGFETSLDVEWAHAMAPGANIVLLTSPVSETEGVQGMPEFLALEKYALDHKLGKIISQSWAATENTLFTPAGQQVFADFEAFYQRAMHENVTVFASSGDFGSSNPDVNGNIYPFPTVGYPASSPRVTAVGGTSLYSDTAGNYLYEIAWFAGGGGVSQQFAEPSYQFSLPSSVQQILGQHRGLPDVAYNADGNTTILVYTSFLPAPNQGFFGIGGTSEGSPQWAGIIADANQFAGHPLGFLNPRLYRSHQSRAFHDIVYGANALNGVSGYVAVGGWDATTGWGTPDAGRLIRMLAETDE